MVAKKLDSDDRVPKVSVVVTVLNEEATILSLLNHLRDQSLNPDEIVIVDGGSTDSTFGLLKQFLKLYPEENLKILKKTGNRSVGRNFGIKKSKNDWIAITDAGCIPEKKWLEELVKCQRQSGAEVVAGYYRSEPKTPFQAAVVPYALVMPDRVDESNFLPATRSMLMSKSAWKSVGGFDEKLSDNEDFALANKFKHQKIGMEFARKAVVVWEPRSTLKEFFVMIYRFARGDVQAGIIRPKVLLIFFRYLVAMWIFLMALSSGSMVAIVTIVLGIITYIIWAIQKNFWYAKNGWYWLPVLQLVSDFAVMAGSLAGLKRGMAGV